MLQLRGRALLWGIERILTQVAPGIDANTVAKKILEHPTIKPTRFGSATAIHFDEMVTILGDVIKAPQDGSAPDIYAKLRDALKGAPVQELTTLAGAVENELSRVLPQEVARVKEATARATAAATAAGAKIRFWFDTVMDRTTERFVSHTRIVTVVAAVAFAFGARIDSVDIFKQLSQKHDVRARLVQMADPVLKQADTMLQSVPTPTAAAAAPPAAAGAPAQPPALAGDAVAKLSNQVKTLKDDLAQTQLQMIPGGPFSGEEYTAHWLGILISAFFLALGAPFWFNTLRQLSNLRPILAAKVDAKSAGDDAAAG